MTRYEFKKNGKTYTTANAGNRIDAQAALELQFQINLRGAAYKVVWKHKVIEQGISR